MDPKSRRSRRKPCTEKTIVVPNESDILSSVDDDPEKQLLHHLTVAADLTDKNSRMVIHEAIAGRRKAEDEVAYLKQELNKAMHQGFVAEERLAHLDAALKGCMQQINTLREEQDDCNGSVASSDQCPERKRWLEVELAETKENLRRIASELRNLLLQREDLIKQLEEEKQCLESVEKENTLLKYECCALEREVAALNAETRYDASTPPIASLNKVKVAELEAECQKLRLMLQRKVGQGQGIVNANSRRRSLNGDGGGAMVCRDSQGNSSSSSRKINFLVDRLCDVEGENAALKHALSVKDRELRDSKLKYANTDYRLAVVEATRKRDFTDAQQQKQMITTCAPFLLSQLEHSTKAAGGGQEEPKALRSSDSKMSLMMNHFVKDAIEETLEKLDIESKERVQRSNNWPWDALHIIVEQHLASKRSLGDLMEDIKSALDQSCPGISGLEAKQTSSKSEERLAHGASSSLSKSICTIIELLQGISPCSLTESSESEMNANQQPSNADYSVYVFRWRTHELIGILNRFILACCCFISGGNNNNLETFACELKSALEWTVGKCITLQDAAQVRDKIRKHFGLDRSKSDEELDITTATAAASLGNHNVLTEIIKMQSNLQEVNKGLRDELDILDSTNQELEMQLTSVKEDNKALGTQLQEAKESIRKLEMEVEDLRGSKGVVEEQMENLKMINEDLDTSLTVSKSKLNENLQQISSLEVELEDKNSCCEELEAVCLELQLQLEIMSKSGSPNPEDHLSRKNSIKGWDSRTALVRLTEHEKTIQAVETLMEDGYDSSPTTTNCEDTKQLQQQHFTLRDRMLAEEDNAQLKEMVLLSPPPIQNRTDSMRTINHSPMDGTDKIGALAVVPAKKSGGGFGIIRKLFWKRKWTNKKKTSSIVLHRNPSNLMR